MNVLINATVIARKRAGVGVYAENLIRELVSAKRDAHLFILALSDDEDLDYSDHSNVTMIWAPAKIFRILPLRFVLLEQLILPFLLWKHKIDVVHSLHYSFPLIRFTSKTVVTIHDMTFFSMPEVHVPLKTFIFRRFIKASARWVDSLIFVSRSAEHDYRERFGQPRGSTSVIHHGKSDLFVPSTDPTLIADLLSRYSLPASFILFVGTIEPRKNLLRLVNAFATIAASNSNTSLVVAGMKGWLYDEIFENVRRLNLESRVLFTGFVAERDKPTLLAAAAVFAYPSLYEGFGIPVLEALACGTPTVTSNTSSLPEVAGTAALMVDPHNTKEIAAALDRLLNDQTLRAALREASLHQAAKFTWPKAAQQTLDVYKSALQS
ncbi:glycosyltransferase family 4 protein [Edaphobacter aggregans]|uniref:glycosyltransferase family 4 protein n=1 Tax=Edaphobacter aggregans TaxID=570835 RepID=UPI0006900852|nr:glycosyltransferase family 1 protein [Edaphobacter aggregans]